MQAQFPFPPLLPWPTQSPENANWRTPGSAPALRTARTEQGKGKGGQHPTQPHGFPHLPPAGAEPAASLKEAQRAPGIPPSPAAACLHGAWACDTGLQSSRYSCFATAAAHPSSDGARRRIVTLHLRSGLFAIFHSIAAFADRHLLTGW